MTDSRKLPSRSTSTEVQDFLKQVAQLPKSPTLDRKGRLLFAMDATASREPTWRQAQRLQAEMFDVAATAGGLEIQLCYYRGMADFHTSPWLARAEDLRREMADVACLGGYTQIGRVVDQALAEARRDRLRALVFVGDCMEENIDELCRLAGELGLLGVKAFMFQEGDDPTANLAFRQIAKLTGGAHCRFNAGSADQLRDLLGAVAAYAAGGLKALEQFGRNRGGAAVQLLTHQVKAP